MRPSPFLLCGLLLLGPLQQAVLAEELPEPLTLEFALSLADEFHPDLAIAQAALEEARGGEALAGAENALQVAVEARARWVDPAALAADQRREDHRASLVVRKPLYDFGRGNALRAAAAAEVDGERMEWLEARQWRRLQIMAYFFDVILADIEYTRDNGAMAIAFIRFDRARDRLALGQSSELEVLELQSEFERIRHLRFASQSRQRSTRQVLANSLNRPDTLPSRLRTPRLAWLEDEPPPLAEVMQRALEENPALRAQRARVEAARHGLEAAAVAGRPRLSAELELSAYHREMGSHDRWRSGLLLEVPILDGGKSRGQRSTARAQLMRAEAELRRNEMALRQEVTESWQRLRDLTIRESYTKALGEYRDYYLDRSRALYEMEVQADIGDSMVQLTDAELQAAGNRFQRALARARLDALMGKSLD